MGHATCARADSTKPGAVSKSEALRIAKAGRDAVGRRIRVEGQPGGAGLGDADLGDQEILAARHPQADDMARADTAMIKAARYGFSPRLDLGIGKPPLGRNHGCGLRIGTDGRREDFTQKFVADQMRASRTAQSGLGRRALGCTEANATLSSLARLEQSHITFEVGQRMRRVKTRNPSSRA